MNFYQQFIYKRTYSRWLEKLKRRETWDETVERYETFFSERIKGLDEKYLKEFKEATGAVRGLNVMPSMRSLWTAGEALEKENISGYNCAYTVVDDIRVFGEILYILMNGTGVGFSTERQYINKLPEVPKLEESQITIRFNDSKRGWAEGYSMFIDFLYLGKIPSYDLGLIRPKGARLKTFGGRASGPEPLKELLEFTVEVFKKAQGRKLNSVECYDLVCKIANCVVSGGVRRSATINLSNLTDLRMRHAKDGQFWLENPQRQLSNNSVAYTEKPDMRAFMEEWLALIESKSGERGIVNRQSLQLNVPSRRENPWDYGVNPCGEIILRPKQFCNLTEVVIRPSDSLEDLIQKVKHATILGILQSTLTDFGFLSEEWKKNCEEERLLGVSLTGLMDHPVLQENYDEHYSESPVAWLMIMKQTAIDTAKEWSEALGINMPTAITCVKPSGTVSQLVDTASGLHPRYAPYYIRRVRVTYTDPLAMFLMSKGVPVSPEVGQTWENVNTVVFDFPIKSPEGSVFRNDRTAIEQLEYWKMLKLYWCEHNPSCTIYVKDDEWLEVGSWVYKNWDIIGGLSFLPYDGGSYQLAPYEEITKEQYEQMTKEFPQIDFEELSLFEHEDKTQGSSEYACTGGACELN
jgi:ribonucleoside-diphosphate reductase alpha chain